MRYLINWFGVGITVHYEGIKTIMCIWIQVMMLGAVHSYTG